MSRRLTQRSKKILSFAALIVILNCFPDPAKGDDSLDRIQQKISSASNTILNNYLKPTLEMGSSLKLSFPLGNSLLGIETEGINTGLSSNIGKNQANIDLGIGRQIDAAKRYVEVQAVKFIMRTLFDGEYDEELDVCYCPVKLRYYKKSGPHYPYNAIKSTTANFQYIGPGYLNTNFSIYLNGKEVDDPLTLQSRDIGSFTLANLTPETNYEVYIVVPHPEKNLAVTSNTLNFTTKPKKEAPPFVTTYSRVGDTFIVEPFWDR